MKRFARLGLKSAAPLLSLAFALGACSSGKGDDDGFGNTAGVPGSSGALGFGGKTGTGGGTTQGGAGMARGGSTGTGATSSRGGTGGSSTAACNGVPYTAPPPDDSKCTIQAEQEAKSVPVDMYIMMDRSVSMLNLVPNTNINRWEAFLSGMQEFVDQSRTKNLRAGINYFPASAFGDDGTEDCNVDLYAEPKVSIAQVMENGDELIDSINENQPGGYTPTLPALQGAIKHAKEWKASGKNEGRAVVVVLVTDGYPTQCQMPISIAGIAAEAKAAYTDAKIRTFVIGLDAGFNLDTIAEAGGTGTATLLDKGEPAGSLVDALVNITETKVPCEYEIPTPPDMTEIDQNKVQLIFTPNGAEEQEIPRVESYAACAINPNGGWYYDNPNNPKQILVCPCTCSRLNTAGRVRVSIGCEPTFGPR